MSLIYVVEDDTNIAEIESFALQNVGYQVETFPTAKEFNEAMNRKLPALILLDIMLPDVSGLEILKGLRSRTLTKDIPVIMVTAKTTELDRVKGLDFGADDYICKPFGVMEMISRIKALLRRLPGESGEEVRLTLGPVLLDKEKHEVHVRDQLVELTYKEFELLQLLMSNAGTVTTREKILNKVWETDFEGESRTLDMHIKTLRQKLKDAGSMIKTVRNVGYIMDEEQPDVRTI
ncbi:MAG: response regulator transcription factor [Lachnospiraceae bacterium]|nr:response regulator transcription factor [Lachnospiraceae bacterium]